MQTEAVGLRKAAEDSFAEAFAQYIANYNPEADRDHIVSETRFALTRLGSVALVTEVDLAKALQRAEDVYVMRHPDLTRYHKPGWL